MARTFVIVLALSLSGCAGLFGPTPGPGEGQTGESVTPASVPTPEETNARTLGPTNNETDQISVYQTDQQIRNQRSYRVERTVSVTTPNGTVTYHWGMSAAPDGHRVGQLRIRSNGTLPPRSTRILFWGNGTTMVARFESPDSRRPVTRFRDVDPAPYRPGDGLLPEALASGDLSADYGRYDDPRVAAQSAGPFRLPADALPFATEPSDDVTVEVTLLTTGLIQSAEIRYQTVYNETPVRVTLRERTTAVGETNVTRPAWARR